MSDGGWIQVFSGLKFYPLDPVQSEFRIRDVARALSMQCRYNGHVVKFYSVAEHSVRVSRRCEQVMIDMGYPEGCEEVETVSKQGLLHDASEAYLSDLPRPVKHLPELEAYRQAEKRLQGDIFEWCGLPREEHPIVKAVDAEILGTEARQLLPSIHKDWHATCPGGQLPAEIPGLVLGWKQDLAENTFLRRYARLFGPEKFS